MDRQPTQTSMEQRAPFSENIAAWLSFAALALASVAVAFPDLPYISLPIAALLVAYVVLMTRRPGPILMAALSLALPGSFFFGGTLSAFLPGAFFLALYVAVAAGASLTLLKKTPVFSLLASALAFGLSALVSGGLLARALPALFALPAYLLLALAHFRKERRSIQVLAAQSGFLLVALALTAAYFIKTYGALNRETILGVMDGFREQFLETLRLLRTELNATFAEAGLEIPAAVQSLLEDATLSSFVQTVTVLLPGVAAALCGVAAFFGQSLFLTIRQREDDEFAKTPDAVLFSMGIPSAVVYLVSLLLTIFLDTGSLAYAVAENLSIILLLPFCFSGFQRVIALMFLAPKGMRWLFLLLFFALSCCLSVGVVELLALYAAFDAVFAPIRKKVLSRKNGADDGGSD
ncbi:MAG: hypothetical protein IJR88_05700 [Clostridia bacterium]|nr:hypothetical protein [Clostridia bacterium]